MQEEDESPEKNVYKIKAFKTAIKVIQQLDHPLRSIEEAKNVSVPHAPEGFKSLIGGNRSGVLAVELPDG